MGRSPAAGAGFGFGVPVAGVLATARFESSFLTVAGAAVVFCELVTEFTNDELITLRASKIEVMLFMPILHGEKNVVEWESRHTLVEIR